MVGRSMVVSANSALDKQGGYYCKVCDCTVKDSMSWLDHVNGKKHNRALGMNMRVERATVEDVRSKMDEYKNKPDHRAMPKKDDIRSAVDDLDARIDR
jgi:U4/U6.U5 tri-snRNP component SNU23